MLSRDEVALVLSHLEGAMWIVGMFSSDDVIDLTDGSVEHPLVQKQQRRQRLSLVAGDRMLPVGDRHLRRTKVRREVRDVEHGGMAMT